ncbi:MAG: c-type cytochrome [Anaerolineales bacterium]
MPRYVIFSHLFRFPLCLPLLLLLLIALTGLAACGSDEDADATAGPTAPPTLDPASPAGQGQIVFQQHCTTCHVIVGDRAIVGPSLANIANVAAERVPGQSAEDYLRESIVMPNAYIVDGFAMGSMQGNFAETLSDEEVDQLVAYMLTLE